LKENLFISPKSSLMKKSLTLYLLLASLYGIGQDIPNGNFDQFETIPCPFDSNTTIVAYKDWVLYQTLDDYWDGPLDSSICINVTMVNSSDGVINLQTVDLSRPIFARCKFTESNKIPLLPDWLYNVYFSSYIFNGPTFLQGGTDCTDNMCSGLYIGIQVPDEAGTGTAMRWYKDIPSNSSSVYFLDTCIPTERFENNYLRELIIKMKPIDGALPEDKITLGSIGIWSNDTPNYVKEVIATENEYVGFNTYDVPIEFAVETPMSWNSSFMLQFTNPNVYPSSANPSYIEGRPEINSTFVRSINLIVQEWANVVLQPFVFLRGGLVEGSDSIRHDFNLINNGGDFCLGSIIDFVFEDNTKYIHAGGHVNFEGNNSCMTFRNGSTLEIADGTTMQYGEDGRGILVLRSGGQMKLGKGSTLLFDGLLWLQGIATDKHPDPQFYLDLQPGTSLVFGENAHVTNAVSINADVKLNVYMNGGILDDHHLNANARNRINRIYPKPSAQFSENVKLLQNPTAGDLRLAYISEGQERVAVDVHDLQGKLLWSKRFETSEGHNLLTCEWGNLATGIYLATLSGNAGSASFKVVKTD
jgi:hypothetical protein